MESKEEGTWEGSEVVQIPKYKQNERLGAFRGKELVLCTVWLRLMLNTVSTNKTKMSRRWPARRGVRVPYPWSHLEPHLICNKLWFIPSPHLPSCMVTGERSCEDEPVCSGWADMGPWALRANGELIRAHFKPAPMKLAHGFSPSFTQNWKDRFETFLASYSLTHAIIRYACAKFHMPLRLML